MYRFGFICLIFALLSINAYAEPVVDEETVRSISAELAQAGRDKNISVIEKYIYPGSILIVDMDPAPGMGETEIGYEDYMKLTEQSWSMINSVDIHDEELSLSVDKDKNQATIEEKTTVDYEMAGMKIRDVAISKTTYGVVEGQIKILKTSDQLISSGPVE